MRSIDPKKKLAIRTALRVHDHLVGVDRLARMLRLPGSKWDEVNRYVQRLEHALSRGWHAASDSVLSDLDYALRGLRYELESCHTSLPRTAVPTRLAAAGEIVADILALDSEFDGLQIDLESKEIEVQTDPIILEETHLGTFRIVLRWEEIGRSRPYEVIADSPVPPEQDSEVTHPHVRDNLLCEGEGAAPIRKALAEGRLLDFFTIVRQVLESYNSSSAYVPLDRWNGVSCRDCAYAMSSYDYSTCDRCENPLCYDCSHVCQ